MAEQELFHMQLHPEKPAKAVDYAKKGLERTCAIGLDFGDAAHRIIDRNGLGRRPLTSFSDRVIDALGRAGVDEEGIRKRSPKRLSNRDFQRRVQRESRRAATYLKQFRDLRPGAVGLIRGGKTPVALVKVTRPSIYGRRVLPWEWYRYRYPVQILGWYEEDEERWPDIRLNPPAPGAFQLLRGDRKKEKSEIQKAVERWLGHIGCAPQAANPPPDDNLGDDDETEFPEGKVLYRKHRARERNAKLVRLAKKRAMQRDGRLLCKACGFDFAMRYGKVGHGYIECHHTLPVSKLKPNERTKLKDVALLCSNCHRMVHRGPWLRMNQLSRLLVRK